MYAVVDDFNPAVHLRSDITIDETTSYVSFKLNERYQRLCLWINQVGENDQYFNVMTVFNNILFLI